MSEAHDEPFTISQVDGDTTILINPVVCQRPQVVAELNSEWIRTLRGQVQVDFSQVPQLNSILVAWLFQLVQWNRGRVSLSEASHGIRRQLKQYHLQHFIDFPMSDIESSNTLPGFR